MRKKDLSVDHILRLTDDTGIFQHSLYATPDLSKGYTTDDNSRALIAISMLYETYKDNRLLGLLYKYMSFLLYAQNDKGMFKNFMDYNRKFIEETGSEDCFGRCLWSLGYILNISLPKGLKNSAIHLLKKALPNVYKLSYVRSKAYTLIGLCYLYNSKISSFNVNDIKDMINLLSNDLLEQYNKNADEKWKWFEDTITYSNALIPWALIKSYSVIKRKEILDAAVESMNFLERIYFKNDYFKPVGCKGWFKKNKEPAEFDEQPIEACETALMYVEAYHVLKERKYMEKAIKCDKWYLGENSKKISLIDSETGGCYDGITNEGVNLNEGSESIISRIIANMAVNNDYLIF
ncbi:MAG: glycosyltransferase [Thermoanaerobacteraceae bacterium]|nr:glycosyltransferase [Thermoanaerobacteraceae bacterium]